MPAQHYSNKSNDTGASLTLLRPGTSAVARNSALGVLLRRLCLAGSSGLFDGLLQVYESLPSVTSAMKRFIDELEGRLVASSSPQVEQALSLGNNGCGIAVASSTSSSLHRHRYLSALTSYDYPAAVDALHAMFDSGYGAAIGGASAADGFTTALGLLTRSSHHSNVGVSSEISTNDAIHNAQNITSSLSASAAAALTGNPALSALLTSPFSRTREILIAASSPPSVGGISTGRSLLHYALLQLAATELWFGHVGNATAAVRECLRAAHAAGDVPCASLALQLLAECEEAAAAAVVSTGSPVSAVNLDGSVNTGPTGVVTANDRLSAFVSISASAVRATEAGLWRQAIAATLQAAELRHGLMNRNVSPLSSATDAMDANGCRDIGAAADCDDFQRLLDGTLSDTASSVDKLHTAAGGGSMSSSSGYLTAPSHASAESMPTAPVPAWLSLEPSVGSRMGGFGIGSVAPITAPSDANGASSGFSDLSSASMASAAAATAASPLVSPSVAIAAAYGRRLKAKDGAAAGSQLLPSPLTGGGAGALTLPAAGQPLPWSQPQPLSATDVMSAHAAAHAMRARCFASRISSGGGSAGSGGAGDTGAGSPALEAAASLCAAIAQRAAARLQR